MLRYVSTTATLTVATALLQTNCPSYVWLKLTQTITFLLQPQIVALEKKSGYRWNQKIWRRSKNRKNCWFFSHFLHPEQQKWPIFSPLCKEVFAGQKAVHKIPCTSPQLLIKVAQIPFPIGGLCSHKRSMQSKPPMGKGCGLIQATVGM